MVIIYEIIYFLLYHSILVSIVDTLETPNDLFNDSANKILPEQLLLQSSPDTDVVKTWFDQVHVQSSNTSVVVRRVSTPGIKYYVGLYFIIEQPLNSSRGINFLYPHVRILNRFLSKVQTLTYIAGVAHVPPLPLSSVLESDFSAGIKPKLEDILRSRIFGAIIVVFVFIKKSDALNSVISEFCTGPNIVYWNYDLNPTANKPDLNDLLFQEIVLLLGACRDSCDGFGNPCHELHLYELPVKDFSNELFQCLIINFEKNQLFCTKNYPEDVYIPVCGNGIIENTESCDCLKPLECGSKCDANCILRKGSRGGTNRYFIIIVSAAIIALIFMASSLFLFLYFKQRNGVESRGSFSSLPRGGSKTELNIPSQFKLKDWTFTCTVNEVTMRNSKSNLDLCIKKISSKDSSKSKLQAISKERLKPKKVTSNDFSEPKTKPMGYEILAAKKISSKDRSQLKTNSISKERMAPKKISSVKLTQNKSAVGLTKSIKSRKTLASVGKSRTSINPKQVTSKSLLASKIQKKI